MLRKNYWHFILICMLIDVYKRQVQSDALTKEQKLKLRWKTLELLEGK